MLQACRCCDRLDALAAAAATPTVVTTKGGIAHAPGAGREPAALPGAGPVAGVLRLPLGETDDGTLVRPQVRGLAHGMRRAS